MSSFGPCVALAALGSTLQNTFAAGNRVLDILDEKPLVEEITGKAPVVFESQAKGKSKNISVENCDAFCDKKADLAPAAEVSHKLLL